jgi:hypothetical protein
VKKESSIKEQLRELQKDIKLEPKKEKVDFALMNRLVE